MANLRINISKMIILKMQGKEPLYINKIKIIRIKSILRAMKILM